VTVFSLLAAVLASATPVSIDAVVSDAATAGFAGEVIVSDRKAVSYDRVVSARGRPHRRGELWRWASVTKQLTATLTLQAVADGRLGLDDTVATRLPSFRGTTASRVTVRMLLQHTSGLPNPDDTPTVSAAAIPVFYQRRVGGVDDALGYCAGPVKAEPGAGFSYNNCDYIVLGDVLEKVSGKSFAALLETRIAKPAGLTTLRFARVGHRLPSMALGVQADGKPEPRFELGTFGASGAAYGTPDDLARFDRALLNGVLLPPEQQAPAWKGDPRLGYVALGVWGFPANLAGCRGQVDLVERRGEIGGVEVRNLLAPKLGKALVVFADRSDLDFGEIWRGEGLSYRLASAAFCPAEIK
jgi:D-alanyl-D-alanine carboxypeptidase